METKVEEDEAMLLVEGAVLGVVEMGEVEEGLVVVGVVEGEGGNAMAATEEDELEAVREEDPREVAEGEQFET